MTIFQKHQLKIARKTIRMSDAAVKILGGMSKEEAHKIIDYHRALKKQKGR